MKTPKKLFHAILRLKGMSTMKDEDCIIPNRVNNCYRVITKPAVPFKVGNREVTGTTTDQSLFIINTMTENFQSESAQTSHYKTNIKTA